MERDSTIIRCPQCGGVHLQALYDTKRAGNAGKNFLLFGAIGLACSALKKNKNTTAWLCLDCGYTFPMD